MKDFYINTLGMEMVLIQSGSFMMGGNDELYFDEAPLHEAVISQPFYISRELVTIDQFKEFYPKSGISERYSPYASGISWYEADDFCKRMSKNEGVLYRLPTECEWEYVCKNYKSSVNNMLIGMLEWCLDWYGEYEEEKMIDPFGARSGSCKVIKGGSPDCEDGRWAHKKEGGPGHYSYLYKNSVFEKTPLNFRRPSNRAGLPPSYGYVKNEPGNMFGAHNIGFRLVQSNIGSGSFVKEKIPYVRCCVKQSKPDIRETMIEDPYYKRVAILPVPPENCDREAIDKAGFAHLIRGHNHCPGLAVCPNGDLLAVFFTSYYENEPGASLIACRLRYGAVEWDFPEVLIDIPGVCDSAPLLFRDDKRLYLFWGSIMLDSAYPFQWIYSEDNGQTWSGVKYPVFENKAGAHSKQPINSAFRVDDNTICLSCDGWDQDSLLWVSEDNMITWKDPLGRTFGRHTTFALLKNGGILGMGGKNTNIDGYMPRSISKDLGKTWEKSKTPFPALKTNQRPSLLRLKSGRLFFAGDFQDKKGNQPSGISQKGSYAALSSDEGETWMIRKLKGTMKHENPDYMAGSDTLGYSVASQSDDGNIHLISTMNEQCLHFELNESWILCNDPDEQAVTDDQVISESVFDEYYDNGVKKCSYSGVYLKHGRFLLNGKEVFYHPDGKPQKITWFEFGKKTGKEEYFNETGIKSWQWEHRKDGKKIWTQYHINGSIKSISEWSGNKADGRSVIFNKDGSIKSDSLYINGAIEGKGK